LAGPSNLKRANAMSALNAHTPPSSLEEERRAHEPSMEEILASIRRIIADDDNNLSARRERQERRKSEDDPADRGAPPEPAAARPRAVAIEEAPATNMRGDLDHSIAESQGEDDEPRFDAPLASDEEEPASYQHDEAEEPAAEPEAELHEDYSAHEPAEQEHHSEAREIYARAESPAPLVSPDAAAAITAQFQTLAASMVINDSGLLHDYAREMLRPMLKAWLDDNLPVLVERLVRVEIERVARGGRR
jgi:hypothetical protein